MLAPRVPRSYLQTFWVTLGLCLAVGCKGKDRPPIFEGGPKVPNPDVPSERLPEPTDAFVETACEVSVANHVTQCGVVTVPLAPGSDKTIKLQVVRVFTNAKEPQADPIIYLEGGPGASSTDGVDYLYPAFQAMAPDRDFIFFDQRGVGASKPALNCFEGGTLEEALDKCFASTEKATDPNAFNTINNATDVDKIREAFGYDQLNLLGISYGTRLALTVMRDHPDGVRSAIIDSVVPLQVDLLGQVGINGYDAFLTTFAACAADADCNSAYPNPLAELTKLTASLNDEPATVSGFPLDGDTVVTLVFNLLYSPYTIGYVPQLIHNLSEGDYSLFEQLEPVAGGGGLAFGMHLSLHCSEEIPFSTREAFEAFDEGIDPALRPGLTGIDYFDYCEHWPVKKAADSENEAVVSPVKTLVLAGKFDPITPPNYAEAAAASLENSQYFLLEGESHGASVGECGLTLARQFFDAPGQEIDAACLSDVPGIEFESLGAQSGKRTIGGKVRFSTSAPSEQELQEALEDLRRRRLY